MGFQNFAARRIDFCPLLSIFSRQCKKLLLIFGFSDNIFSSDVKTSPKSDASFQADCAVYFAFNSGAISGKVDDSMFRVAIMRANRKLNGTNAAEYLKRAHFLLPAKKTAANELAFVVNNSRLTPHR